MEKKSVSVTLEHVTKRFRNVKGKADVIAVNDSHFIPFSVNLFEIPAGFLNYG